jgi:GrpB-like predicted nucleotidyltransferase (UPF0157 family)
VITAVDYDPAWPERFEILRNEYALAMARAGVPVVDIKHFGSTSVPDLAAKPIIDCDIVVRQAHVVAASNVLVSLGFTPLGELGIPQRWAFKEPTRLSGTNTYVIVDGCLSLRNHLAVRDVLRAMRRCGTSTPRSKGRLASALPTSMNTDRLRPAWCKRSWQRRG